MACDDYPRADPRIFVSKRSAGSQSMTQKHYLCTIVYKRTKERRCSILKEVV